ncbi:MAG: hypothetical protein D4R67_10825 [Bacteroidetes bacterium]|nr:MAG: hypothetical protein D4R67_10825 [Bacteroidota bacterium]
MRKEELQNNILTVHIHNGNSAITDPLILAEVREFNRLHIKSGELIENVLIESLSGETISRFNIQNMSTVLDLSTTTQHCCLIRIVFTRKAKVPYSILLL